MIQLVIVDNNGHVYHPPREEARTIPSHDLPGFLRDLIDEDGTLPTTADPRVFLKHTGAKVYRLVELDKGELDSLFI